MFMIIWATFLHYKLVKLFAMLYKHYNNNVA